jgi:hypothetical protein
MPITINGTGTITGISAGGLPDAIITQPEIAAGVGSTGPAFSVYQTTAQTLSSATLTKITFDTEEYDTNNNFASSAFTPTVAGYYLITAKVQGNASYTAGISAFYKNGSLYRYGYYNANATDVSHPATSCLIYCNGSTDYIEFYASFTTGQDTAGVSNSGNAGLTWFQGYMARAA